MKLGAELELAEVAETPLAAVTSTYFELNPIPSPQDQTMKWIGESLKPGSFSFSGRTVHTYDVGTGTGARSGMEIDN